jgi:pyruvate carboxylase
MKPRAARELVTALKQETGLPVHFHTHDTSGGSVASVLAAVDAGVDAVDAAMDSLSGLTSQPNLGAIVAALKHGERDTGLSDERIRCLSDYWEQVRWQYAAFESDLKAGASEVYLHEMPGGQFTNLKEQARALGLEHRWHEVARTYAGVNMMLGDIIKVTPSSKMVGDMALSMVSAGLSVDDVVDPNREVAFPESVVSYFRGELGQPHGGFPKDLQRKVLKGEAALTDRPGASKPPLDLDAERQRVDSRVNRKINDEEFQSSLMYPEVFTEYAKHRRQYGPVDVLPTPVFFYGMRSEQEISIDLERGKRLVVRCQAIGDADEEGNRRVFFELNGQPRVIKVADKVRQQAIVHKPKAELDNPNHLASPMPGVVASLAVIEGQQVFAGDLLMTIEAMKMETAIHSDRDGTIDTLVATAGSQVDAKDLLLTFASK